jgi:hypothetical protein
MEVGGGCWQWWAKSMFIIFKALIFWAKMKVSLAFEN